MWGWARAVGPLSELLALIGGVFGWLPRVAGARLPEGDGWGACWWEGDFAAGKHIGPNRSYPVPPLQGLVRETGLTLKSKDEMNCLGCSRGTERINCRPQVDTEFFRRR